MKKTKAKEAAAADAKYHAPAKRRGAEKRAGKRERAIKPLEELKLMDDYMFYQVMREPKRLKPLLECVLGVRIVSIRQVEAQKTEKEGYESKGIRLDLYVEDENGVIYNVEAQAGNQKSLPKRMRFYQSVIDIHVLRPGADYQELKKTFIIFLCNYDPYGKGQYIYTFENICREEPGLLLGDEAVKVIVNTKGHKGDISRELRELLQYLNTEEVTGEYSRELGDAVKAVKENEARRHEYMIMMVREMEIREEGRAEGKEDTLIDNLCHLMKNMKWTATQAMDALGLDAKEQEKYLPRL